MASILLAGIFFVGIHLLIAGTGARDRLVSAIGERAYLGAFSLLSLLGIVWLCRAWSGTDAMAPWWGAAPLRPIALVAMFFSVQCVVIGLATPSPTVVGGEGILTADAPRGILRITRHPFLWGVALWGLCHALTNPDPPSLLFFGAFLALALIGPASIDAKRARRHGEAWERFAAVTSNLPFAAILSGRNRLRLGELGIVRVALATLVYAALLALHPVVFGVSPL